MTESSKFNLISIVGKLPFHISAHTVYFVQIEDGYRESKRWGVVLHHSFHDPPSWVTESLSDVIAGLSSKENTNS